MKFTAYLLASVIFVTGCRDQPAAPWADRRIVYSPQIVYPGTKAYERRIASLKLSPEAARIASGRPWGGEGPACVIDDCYLFSKPYKYKRIDLAGTYVNGLTGEVEERDSTLSLLGDNSDLGILKLFPYDMPKSVSDARVYP